MDVVEAIDAWIDEQIDDLTDDELELILEILDAVSASELADLDGDDVYIDDIDQMVDETGGSKAERRFTEAVLRGAFFDEPFEPDAATADEDADHSASDGPDHEDPDSGDADDEGLADDDPANDNSDEPVNDDLDNDDLGDGYLDNDDLGDGYLDNDDLDNDDLDNDDLDNDDLDNDDLGDGYLDSESINNDDLLDTDEPVNDLSDADLSDADLSDSDSDSDGHLDSLAVLADPDPTTELVVATAPIVELRPFDDLGPTFLPESTSPIESSGNRPNMGRVLLPAFMIAALAVFAFGMMQLIGSLDEGDSETTEVATERDEASAPAPQETAAPDGSSATAESLDPAAPAPTATPELPPPPRVAIRLVTGDIMLATYPQAGLPPTLSALYEVDDDLLPAIQVAWLGDDIGVVDTEGNVLVLDPDARRPRPAITYEASEETSEAAQIAPINAAIAIRTIDGNITLTPREGPTDPDALELLWDAEAEGAAATDMSALSDLLPFVLDNGNASMVVTSQDNAVVPIWSAEDQPEAVNVAAFPDGILLGVGRGAIARYQLGEVEGDRLESVWNPFLGNEIPAIGYSPAGDSTAVILGDGTILLTESDTTGQTLWDPAETEIRAFAALGHDDHVIVLLETGSVVRIPLNSGELIESIWDITDETLNPANQLAVEP